MRPFALDGENLNDPNSVYVVKVCGGRSAKRGDVEYEKTNKKKDG